MEVSLLDSTVETKNLLSEAEPPDHTPPEEIFPLGANYTHKIDSVTFLSRPACPTGNRVVQPSIAYVWYRNFLAGAQPLGTVLHIR